MEKKAKASRAISDATLDRYLSAILTLRQRIPIVRSVDVANHLGNSKACVSMALKQMIVQQLVQVGPHGALLLTDSGERRATGHRDRCDYFKRLLLLSGVGEQVALAEAAAITTNRSSSMQVDSVRSASPGSTSTGMVNSDLAATCAI